MASPDGRTPAELLRLTDEAQLLHDRLRRVVVALALTEEVLADQFERFATQGGARGTERRLEAKRARESAEECRTFAVRLDEIGAAFTPKDEPPTDGRGSARPPIAK
jgi:hypothetical protein